MQCYSLPKSIHKNTDEDKTKCVITRMLIMLFINCNIVTGCCSRVEEKRKSGGSKVKVEYRVLHWTYLFSVVVGLISSLDLLLLLTQTDGQKRAEVVPLIVKIIVHQTNPGLKLRQFI